MTSPSTNPSHENNQNPPQQTSNQNSRPKRRRHHKKNDASQQHPESSEQSQSERKGPSRRRGRGGRRHNYKNRGQNTGQPAFGAFSTIHRQPSHELDNDNVSVASSETSSSSHHHHHRHKKFSKTQTLTHRLNKGIEECSICFNKIRQKQQIWSCSCCKIVMHLSCIREWISKSCNIDRNAGNREFSPEVLQNLHWKCPHCQTLYSREYPTSKCFCSKVENPPFNPSINAHSCGEVCNKLLNCNVHHCQSLCHPGHCEPCSGSQVVSCGCGKESFRVKCSEANKTKSCGAICEKPLNCNIHNCSRQCHDGPCDPCQETYQQKCYCGRIEEVRPCVDTIRDESQGELRTFSCGQVCDRKFDCGNHTHTSSKCHPGDCGQCPLLPENVHTCICGQTPIENLLEKPRTSCLDEIPHCHNKCKKLLPCGQHTCNVVCHDHDVSPQYCMKMIQLKCKCGSSSQKLPCVFSYVENIEEEIARNPIFKTLVDTYLKPLGINSLPYSCEKVCGKLKNCLRHKCTAVCCEGGVAHVCSRVCNRRLSCGRHRCPWPCHSNDCADCGIMIREPIVCTCGKTKLNPPLHCGTPPPECKHPCSIPRPCGHAVNHHCHPRDEPCPPCLMKTSKPCIGGHTTVHDVPCSLPLEQVSCGAPCGRVLQCGNPDHTCRRTCHSGLCQAGPIPDEPTSCSFPCNKRLECGHLCPKSCHPGTDCDSLSCTQKLRVFCDCRRIKLWKNCGEVKLLVIEKFPEEEYDAQNVPDGLIECDSECRRLKRNLGLAEALGVDVVKVDLPTFSVSMKEFGLKNMGFVEFVELNFEKLIDDSARKQLAFKAMSRDKRSFIHSLCEFYRIEAVTVDGGENRGVIITKTLTSRMPKYLLSEVLKDPKKMEKLEKKLEELGITSTDTTTSHQLPVSYKLKQEKKRDSNDEQWDEEQLEPVSVEEQVLIPRKPTVSGTVTQNRWASLFDAKE